MQGGEKVLPSRRNDRTFFNTASVKSWLLERSTKHGRWRTIEYSSPSAGLSLCKLSAVQCPNKRLPSTNAALTFMQRTENYWWGKHQRLVEYWPWIGRWEIRLHIEAESLARLQAEQTSHFSYPWLAQQLYKGNCASNTWRDSSPAKAHLNKPITMVRVLQDIPIKDHSN